MIVALVAVIGSLTVLPATLALLGDRVDKGRIPLIGRLYARSSGHSRAWSALAGAVTRRPRAALALALVVLGGLAVPAIGMDTGDSMGRSLPADLPISKAQAEIEHAFPGAPDDAELVVSGTALRSATAHRELVALGQRARKVTRGHGRIGVLVSKDGGTAVVSVPMPNVGADRAAETVGLLRSDVAPTATRIAPGTSALVAGDAAGATDFTSRLNSSRLKVIGFVLGLAFLLLLAAFRSPSLAAAVMGLNLLSVGAAYGLLVAVFQHTWAEGLLGFTSSGTVINWIPLFLFVILFGLSMDYTVLVLERIREARRNGRTAREAAAEGVGATGGTVTSAAVVMVAVFSVFAMLRTLEFKQLGVGLAAAILLDATIVRGLALPAVVALLGERRWRVPGPRRARRARPAEREAVRV
jgi:RND superfamily putative drug exporter